MATHFQRKEFIFVWVTDIIDLLSIMFNFVDVCSCTLTDGS
jgi:hypothetical protein